MLSSGTCNPFIHLYVFFFRLFCVTCFLFIHLYNRSVAVRFGLVGPERALCSGDTLLAANGGSLAVITRVFWQRLTPFCFLLLILFLFIVEALSVMWRFDTNSPFPQTNCLYFHQNWVPPQHGWGLRGGTAGLGHVQPFC